MPFYEVGDQQAVDAYKKAGMKNRWRLAWLTEKKIYKSWNILK